MMLTVPTHLSPSAISSFASCPAQYRYSYIDRYERKPTPDPLKGTLVHLALQHLMWRPPLERTFENAIADLRRATAELYDEIIEMIAWCELTDEDMGRFAFEAEASLYRYFEIEDPTKVVVLGLELRMRMMTAKGTIVHGVIDRLERDGDLLIATDYKNGKAPKAGWEQDKLVQLHIYAAMCEQTFGVLPDVVQLMYLSTGECITAEPKAAQLRGVRNRADAAMMAITRSCEKGDFRPKVSRLCDWYSFTEICPGFQKAKEAQTPLDAT